MLFFVVALVSIIQMVFAHVKDKQRRGLKFTEFLRLSLVVTAAFMLSQKNTGWVYGWLNLADSTEFIFLWVLIPAIGVGAMAALMALNQLYRLFFNRTNETPIDDEEESETHNTNAGLVASAARSEPEAPKKHVRSKTPDGTGEKKKKKSKRVDTSSPFFND